MNKPEVRWSRGETPPHRMIPVVPQWYLEVRVPVAEARLAIAMI
jgi:hypothetical protein